MPSTTSAQVTATTACRFRRTLPESRRNSITPRLIKSRFTFPSATIPLDTGEWLDKWLETKIVTPRTFDKYFAAVTALKEVLAFADLTEITPELVEKATGGEPGLRSVLSMALGHAVKTGLIGKNIAAVKREQRKPQEGSLYYRADRRAWVAQVTITDATGRRTQKMTYVRVDRKTKIPPDAAIRALEELKKLKTDGCLAANSISTVGELMEEWLSGTRIKTGAREKGLAVRTFEQYESVSKIHIVPLLGNIKVRDLSRVGVEKWLQGLEKSSYTRSYGMTVPYSANTLRLCRTVLGMALEWAIKEGPVSRNVAREARPPGGRPRPEKYSLHEDDARRLIEVTRGTGLGPLWALMITVGLRRGEALGLRWSDFDGESIPVSSQIKIEAGEVVRGDLKTDKSRWKLRDCPAF